MELIHGGDWAGQKERLGNRSIRDFSANVSPLGVPDGVREAICRISNLSVYFMAGMGILPFLAVLGSIPCKKAKVNVQNAQTEMSEYRKDTEHSDTVIPKQRNL